MEARRDNDGVAVEGSPSTAPRDIAPSSDTQSEINTLATRLLAIANRLRQLEGPQDAANPGARIRAVVAADTDAHIAPSPAEAPVAIHLETAREAYATRRRRSAIFDDAEIFGEPAWDILLDLYIALGEGKPVSVSSACIGSAAPPTTGLRWLGVLSDLGLILREHDAEDQRRVLVRLSDKGLAAMDRYFASANMSASMTI